MTDEVDESTNNFPTYAKAVAALEPVLRDFPGVIVALDGRPGTGKTTLGRYLAWRFRVSLIETDWFLVPDQRALTYRNDELRRVLEWRILEKDLPVIVDGAVILRVLDELGMAPSFSIRLKRADVSKTLTARAELARYHRDYPDERVALVLHL